MEGCFTVVLETMKVCGAIQTAAFRLKSLVVLRLSTVLPYSVLSVTFSSGAYQAIAKTVVMWRLT